MNRKRLVLLVLALFSILWGRHSANDVRAQTDIPTLPVSPLPTPSAPMLSPAAEAALRFVAEQEKIPLSDLRVVGDAPMHFRSLERTYQRVVLTYSQAESLREFSVLVAPTTGAIEPDIEAIRQAY